MSFQRYDIKLERDGLNPGRELPVSEKELIALQDFVAPRNMPRLYALAREAARQQVHSADFPAAFNLIRAPDGS